jgi:acetyl esterase/lipase
LTTIDNNRVLHVPARDVPVPAHLSPQAQVIAAGGMMPWHESPALDDIHGWKASIAERDAMVLSILSETVAHAAADVDEIDVDGVHVYVITPHGTSEGEGSVFLELHGGGFIMGGGECCRAFGIAALARTGIRTWAVDYRMPPDDPYPAALDDAVTAYKALLRNHRPEQIVVGGASAGGNLAAALILRARDEGLPLPAAAVILTPASDLTQSGDTFHTNFGVDTIISGETTPLAQLYAPGQDLTDPYLSPQFGDFTKGFPPTLLASGTRDLLLSNTVRMHRALRAARVPADLHVLEAAPHGGFYGAPEDEELNAEIRAFVSAYAQP